MTAHHLVLFMTRGMSLGNWESTGVFDREVALALRLRERLEKISLVTYGSAEELKFQPRLPGIQILYNQWGLPSILYSLLAPLLNYRHLRGASVFRSNQIDGAWTPVLAGRLLGKPVIVRAGYLWMEFVARLPLSPWKKGVVRWLQQFVLGQATAVILTTEEMRQTVIDGYGVPETRITVIPNYVDINLFHPAPDVQKVPGRICFVGRLEAQKNLHMLLEVLAEVMRARPNVHLVCIGEGALGPELAALAQKLKINVEFRGRVANSLLPEEINRAEVFVLPSLYEGHPKSLIEAMACGAAVVGTRVTGIQEVISNGETGLLCEPSTHDMARALNALLGDAELRRQMGAAARTFAEQEYSLESVVDKEVDLLNQLCGSVVD